MCSAVSGRIRVHGPVLCRNAAIPRDIRHEAAVGHLVNPVNDRNGTLNAGNGIGGKSLNGVLPCGDGVGGDRVPGLDRDRTRLLCGCAGRGVQTEYRRIRRYVSTSLFSLVPVLCYSVPYPCFVSCVFLLIPLPQSKFGARSQVLWARHRYPLRSARKWRRRLKRLWTYAGRPCVLLSSARTRYMSVCLSPSFGMSFAILLHFAVVHPYISICVHAF